MSDKDKSVRLEKDEQTNKCSDCLYLDAALIAAQDNLAELEFTIFFDYQCLQIPGGGELNFGIKGGDLRLHLRNAELSDFLVTSDFNWFVDRKTKTAKASSSTHSQTSTSEAKIKVDSELAVSDMESHVHGDQSQIEDNTRFQSWQVTALHGKIPGWRFALKTGEDYLTGNICEERFARIAILNPESELVIRFSIEQRHLHILISAGHFWKKGLRDIRRLRIANLYLWHKLIKPLVSPYLSEVRFGGNSDGA